MRTRVVAAVAAVGLVGTAVAGGIALAADTTVTATCTNKPVVTNQTTTQKITVVCTVPKPPAVTQTVTVPGPTVTVTATPTQEPTPSVTPTPSSTPTVTPTPTDTPSTDVLSLPRIAWDGGPAYYNKFSTAKSAGWADPAFFPIGVFLSKPSHATSLKQLGINFYMGAEHDGSALTSITNTGVGVIAQDEWTKTEIGSNPKVVGHFISDECDMGLGCSGSDEAGWFASQKQMTDRVRAYNDGRFAQANFGNGIVRTWWSPNYMDDHVALLDVVSADKYSYTSPPVDDLLKSSPDWPKGANPATSASYGWQVDQMRRFMTPTDLKPAWVFVEAKRPYLTESNARSITPEQIEGAVWSGLIHEARGVTFFQHNNDPACGNWALIDCGTAVRAKVTALTAEIRSLAPVLNSQSYRWDFGPGTDTMLKTYDGSAYVFAGVGLNETPGAKTFKLPAGVTGTTVTVVGENRTLPVVDGQFSDSFAAEYSHHVYRITL